MPVLDIPLPIFLALPLVAGLVGLVAPARAARWISLAAAAGTCLRAPARLLLPPRARRDGGARRVHGAGSRAVRRLLRPHARALLLSDRAVGRARARAGDYEVRHLHAGRLALHARRGGCARCPC